MYKNRNRVVSSFILALILTLFVGCSGGGSSSSNGPLRADNVNLIFVVSPDLAYQEAGDVDPLTANLTNKGLQRSLLMATYLKQKVLGGNNVTAIYTLAPMTHLQTANNYPDMAGIGYIQQFALLNQFTMLTTTAYSFPLNVAYAPGSVPGGVSIPDPFIAAAQGLDFNNGADNNTALAVGIINANTHGFYVFSAPWETISVLLTAIKTARGYGFNLPATYEGPNHVYAIAITPSGIASLVNYNSFLKPPSTYPVLPSPVASASCNTQQTFFSITRTGGINSVVVPLDININETVYLIRHAEAHPSGTFEDGNYIGAGQWRALSLPDALRGKISPDLVYAIDPAQSFTIPGVVSCSYVRPSLTLWPFAVANNLPFYLVASFNLGVNASDTTVAGLTRDFFFVGGTFSNKTILIAWEHAHFPPLITALLQSYGGTDPIPTLPWPSTDYDTIWRVRLDGSGNLTIDNALCEGIDSAYLRAAPPQF